MIGKSFMKCLRRPHNSKTGRFTSWKGWDLLQSIQNWKTHVENVPNLQNFCFWLLNMEICDSLSLSLLKLWETFLTDDIILAFIAQDGAEPSANSSSVGNLIRLHSFTDDKKYVERAEQIIKASVTLLSKLPLALPELVSNYMLYLQPKRQVHLPSYALSKLHHSLCQSGRDISSQ